MASSHKQPNPQKKHPEFGHLPLSTSGPQDCALTGSALLKTPYFNKGVAFPAEERSKFKLTGLLPQNVQTLDQQVKRAYQQYSSRQDALAKNTFMTSLAEQNQVLYFSVSTFDTLRSLLPLQVLRRERFRHVTIVWSRDVFFWLSPATCEIATRDCPYKLHNYFWKLFHFVCNAPLVYNEFCPVIVSLLLPVDSRSYQRDVFGHLYTHRRRRHSELFETLSKTRGLFSKHRQR